jgi:hypothetical protein
MKDAQDHWNMLVAASKEQCPAAWQPSGAVVSAAVSDAEDSVDGNGLVSPGASGDEGKTPSRSGGRQRAQSARRARVSGSKDRPQSRASGSSRKRGRSADTDSDASESESDSYSDIDSDSDIDSSGASTSSGSSEGDSDGEDRRGSSRGSGSVGGGGLRLRLTLGGQREVRALHGRVRGLTVLGIAGV